ncbi:multidrug efflux SMR transporter [Rhizobacter sp. Root1221]|uniref:DMT family transporter n=1 Tax=Rhizobacter sp. Root1221 TaxID=1736433 RepID=UPI0006F514EE|nr:multidrug efflux SMR transporter [Rhizobacter sp. Root1221]KQV98020.1 quaternary ammonium transporter [Rhizobacter sp. Root1221]
MNPTPAAYGWLAGAIASEVLGTAFLQKSAQFTRLVPTLAMAVLYAASFYFLSQALRSLPLGIAYAIWGGLGIILTAAVGAIVFRQMLDAPAILGIALIVSGVIVINLFSTSSGH